MAERQRVERRDARLCAVSALALVVCLACAGWGRTSPESTAAAPPASLAADARSFAGRIERGVRESTPAWEASRRAPAGSPNVVIVLADDLGFADLGSFGSEIATPNIDRLAAAGLRYRNFSVTGVCSPTRAALLTGLNHHSAGVGWLANMDGGYPGYRGEIAADVPTLAEILRDAGYSTLMLGKWHLTHSDHMSVAGPFDSWPIGRGFERFWGYLDGETNHWMPPFLWSGNEIVQPPDDGSFFFPDAMTDRAIEMLRDLRAADPDKPFFLYYAPHVAHAPHHTKPEDRARYRGAYDRGWDALRAERLARQQQLGIAPDNARLAPYYPGVRPWDELAPDERRMAARLQENYAAFVDNLDQNLGRLIDWLERRGELENTLFIVTSDNGASREVAGIGSWNALQYYHGISSTLEDNLAHYEEIGDAGTHPHYPHGWMQVSNTPFRWAKTMTHGGGVRAPLIVSWPARIRTAGEIRAQLHHVIDLAPTVLEAAGVDPPSARHGRPARPMEGVSLVYSFDAAGAPSRRREQYYEMEGHRGYVADGWKIVTHRDPDQAWDDPAWELYHLEQDFAEYDDLAGQHPEKVAELEAKWWRAAERYQVLPVDDRSPMERGRTSFARMRSFGRKRFVYEPGTNTVDRIRAPLLAGRSFTVTARVARRSAGEDGVLVALGDRASGFAFFVQHDRLHWLVNRAGYELGISSPDTIPAPASELAFEFERGADGRGGVARLRVDGALLAEQSLPTAVPSMSWEGLDIGRDLRLPVTPRYAAPFAFEGDLEEVTFEIR
jgi:arylsulfatase